MGESGYTSGMTGELHVVDFPELYMYKVTTDSGYVLTTFNDLVDNILSYYSSDEEFCTHDVNPYNVFRAITYAEDMEYKRQQMEAYEIINGNENTQENDNQLQ